MPFTRVVTSPNVIIVTGGATSGTATSGGSTTLTDTSKSWTSNQWANRHVWIHTGTGAGQIRVVSSNSANALTVSRAWTTNPDSTSQYIVAHNFVDLKAANDAGSWGHVTGGNGQYRVEGARIEIGDDTTANRGFFGDVNKTISFSANSVGAWSGTEYWRGCHITVKSFGGIAFGRVLNEANRTSADGCSILTEASGVVFPIFGARNNGNNSANPNLIHLASTKFFTTNPSVRSIFGTNTPSAAGSIVWNSDFDRTEFNPGNADTYNVTIQGAMFGTSRASGSFNRVVIANMSAAAAYTHKEAEVSATFRNLVTRNVGSWFQFDNSGGPTTIDCFMVNPDPDVRSISAPNGTGGGARLWEQYEFDLLVRRSSDSAALSSARVRLTESTGAEVLNTTTTANGTIATQTLNRGFYTAAGGNTITPRTPHIMRIRRYGFLPLQVSLDISVKQTYNDFRAADPFVVAAEATAAAYNGIAADGVARTITISSSRTAQEIYDHVAWWQAQETNIQHDVSLSSPDGINYQIAANWTLVGAQNITFGNKRFSGALRYTAAGAYSPSLGTATLTLTAAGTYDLRGATISGTVTLVNTSAGAVTVQLQPGVTFVNSGPNITVDNAVSATFTVSGMVAGSRLLIRRTDTQAVLVNEAVAGTSRAYTYTHTANIPVEIVVRKATGSPAYQEWRTTATLTASGGAVTANQQLDE